MEDHNLLDDAKIRQDLLILEMVQWWEKRRLLYNIIVGLVGSLIVFIVLQQHRYIPFSEILLFAILPYGIAANILYLAGWVMELLIRYYFKITLSSSVRQVLFWLGALISIAPFILALLILLT
jgi:hypothetical protein